MTPPIYLDHSATTPVRPEVFEAMAPYLREHYGNAGSVHRFGREAKAAVDTARDQVAALINCKPREIVFTSGGTEADNLAIRGIVERDDRPMKRLVVSSVEHHAVLHPAQALGRRNDVETVILPVGTDGRVNPDAARAAIDESVALVSIMKGNNETGALQPIQPIAEWCAERGVPFHTDAVQAGGVLPLDVQRLPVSALTLSGHKLNGPKGIGACFLCQGVPMTPQFLGGSQERARRAGTENIPGIVGFGKACELALAERLETAARLAGLRDRLQAGILESIADSYVNGPIGARIPHILNVGFRDVEGESLLLALDTDGIAASSGAACASGSLDPSHVLLAMGLEREDAQSALRFSFGWGNGEADVDRVLDALQRIVPRLRGGAPLYTAR